MLEFADIIEVVSGEGAEREVVAAAAAAAAITATEAAAAVVVAAAAETEKLAVIQMAGRR